jgi:large subunit ribosomal protein L6
MSRLGNKPIQIPNNVEVKFVNNKQVVVKGPKGELELQLMEGVSIKVEENNLLVINNATTSAYHGLYRTLVSNMVTGVTVGFKKQLNLVGIGFKAAVMGNKLNLQLGYSHPTEIEIPQGIEVKVDKNVEITVSGIDNQSVGQFSAEVRGKKPPEPYKGKGIRYKDEYVRKKAGKAAKSK